MINWVFWIWAWFYEIGWLSMLKYGWIEDWLDQFHENVIGSFFPNFLMVAEFDKPKLSWNFDFLFIRWIGNHLGIWFNVDCVIDWIEFESDIKSPNCQDFEAWKWVWFFIKCVGMW